MLHYILTEVDCSEEECITGGCYLHRQKCDGRFDCPDSTDELDCKNYSKNILQLHRVTLGEQKEYIVCNFNVRRRFPE